MVRDAHGIVQIYADDAEDLFQAQGYVQAQDRFYEMDVRRHITSGRLSELFGASPGADRHLPPDPGLAPGRGGRSCHCSRQPPGATWTPTRPGVNAYLRGRSAADISLEYSLLGLQGLDYQPEDWTAADSLAWLKAMAWDLGANLTRSRSWP